MASSSLGDLPEVSDLLFCGAFFSEFDRPGVFDPNLSVESDLILPCEFDLLPGESDLNLSEESDLGLPGESDLSLPGESDLSLPAESDLFLPRESDLNLPEEPDLGLPGESDLGLPGESDLILPAEFDLDLLGESDPIPPGEFDLTFPLESGLALPGESDLALPDASTPALPEEFDLEASSLPLLLFFSFLEDFVLTGEKFLFIPAFITFEFGTSFPNGFLLARIWLIGLKVLKGPNSLAANE